MIRLKKTRLKDVGEFGFIELAAKILSSPVKNVIKGIGDDAAVLDIGRKELLLLTTDMLVEGVHFTRSMNARSIGHKSLACNISDIAAMGGIPSCAVISLGVPPNLNLRFVQELYQGINRLAKKFSVSIVGGDTVKSAKIVINIALLGNVFKENLLLRCGAKKGNRIFVSGPLGKSFVTKKHLRFTPKVDAAQYLAREFKPTSMIDISDGLCGDLGHILKESSVGAVIYEKLIPKTKGATLNNALYDGEDFELLFTLSSQEANQLIRMKKNRFPFWYIGDIVDEKEKLTIVSGSGKRIALKPKSFSHF
ncbi:MAG: thiamine-phosphate kinase [Candidatus Omnitrophota bacterium]